jgi:intergrase/recombinase
MDSLGFELRSPRDLNPRSPAPKNLFSVEKSFTKRDFSLKGLEDKERFEQWLQSEDYSHDFKTDVLSYLRRNVTEIREPFDIVAMFSKIQKGKRHLVLALRTLFKFYEAVGLDSAYLDYLRKAIPKVHCGIDLNIPSEDKILDSLRKLSRALVKYQAVYHLLLDSGLRLAEAVELVNNFMEAEAVNGFYRCEVAMFRGEKQAYYGHFTERTLSLIKQVKGKLERNPTSSYLRKWKLVAPKYLRKYAFDKMIELEVPESVADFIEGRVPTRIGAKHYLTLARQSS